MIGYFGYSVGFADVPQPTKVVKVKPKVKPKVKVNKKKGGEK